MEQLCATVSVRNADQAELQDIKDILKVHCQKVLVSSDDLRRNYVNVRRGHVLDDGVNKINRLSFQPNLPISVKFADEDFFGLQLTRCF
jgi:hypothetical protein